MFYFRASELCTVEKVEFNNFGKIVIWENLTHLVFYENLTHLVFEESKENSSVGDKAKTNNNAIEDD